MAMKKDLPTVAQLAQAAGVSPATVSRVLNHKGIVKADTYNRVAVSYTHLDVYKRQKLTSEGEKLICFVNSKASVAPKVRSMPLSSHSTLSGPS